MLSPDNVTVILLVDEVAKLLHSDQYVAAGQRVANWLGATSGVIMAVEDRTKATEVLTLLLHWLLDNNGYEEAAQILWGESLFTPKPESAQRVWRAFEKCNFILLMGAASMCFSPGTLIRRFDGTTCRADEVRTGDEVAGDDGNPRKVLETHSGKDEMFWIRPNRAPAFQVNSRHILSLVCTNVRRNNGGRYGISSGYTPGKVVDVSVQDYLKWGKQRKRSYKLFTRPAPMPEQPVEVDPYIYGAWLGDGTCVRMELTTPRGPMQEEWCRYWESRGYAVKDTRNKPTCGTWRVESEFVNRGFQGGKPRRFCEWARQSSPGGNKRIRPEYLNNSEENRLKLLAGLIDSDGTPLGSGFGIVTKWVELADDIEALSRSLGFVVRRSVREHGIKSTGFKANYNHLHITGDAIRIPTLEKEGRRITNRNLQNGFPALSFTVEAAGGGEYVGFEVDGNHRFLLPSGIVVHNSKSYSMGVRLMLEWIRDPDYTNIKVLGPSEQHLEDNLFSHLVTLHRQSTIKLPGEIGKLYIGGDTRARKGSISGVVIPLGKKAAGRIQGAKRMNRKTPHPQFGKLTRQFIFLDEIANIPTGVWKDIDNVIASGQGDDGLKIIGAFNPTNQHDEVGLRVEPPKGWPEFDPDADVDWVSTRGWRVVRLDAARCENVVEGKIIYSGLQTCSGFELLIKNAGGMDSPGYWSMARGCFPPTGMPMSIIPAGMLVDFKAEPIWYERPTPCGAVDLALEGGDTAIFTAGLFGLATGFKYAPTLSHPTGRTVMFLDRKGRSQPRNFLYAEAQFPLPKGETVAMKDEIMRVARLRSIRPDWLCVDRTGNGQGVFDLLRFEFGEVIGLNFSEGGSETRIMAEDHAPAKELYDRAHTELWFGARKFIEFGYFKAAAGIQSEVLYPQLTQRRFKMRGQKARVESKAEYRSRSQGKSPDEADSLTLLVYCVRKSAGFVPGMTAENSLDSLPDGGDYDEDEDKPRICCTNRFEDL